MTRKRNLIVGGLAVAALGAASLVAVAGHRGHHGWGGHQGWGGPGHHGRMGHWRKGGFMGRGIRFVCRRNADERIDYMLVHIKHKTDLTDAQMPAFEEFSSTVRTAAAKMRESCPPKPAWRQRDAQQGTEPGTAGEAGKTDEPKAKRQRPSPIERLQRAETMMTAALEAIRTIRPSAAKLYATLSDEQKAKFTEPRRKRGWGKHQRSGKHWRHRRGSGSEDGGDRGRRDDGDDDKDNDDDI